MVLKLVNRKYIVIVGVNVYEYIMCFFLYIFRNLLMVRFIKIDIKMLMVKIFFLKSKIRIFIVKMKVKFFLLLI